MVRYSLAMTYWRWALLCVRAGGAAWTVSSEPPELRAGFLHLPQKETQKELIALY